MRTGCFLAGPLVLLLLAGCAHQQGEAPSRQTLEADSQFEQSPEVAVSADTHYAAGQFAESQNNIGKAIEQYRRAVKARPDHAASLYRLGVLHAQVKQFPEAVAAWKGYITATGGAAGGYSNLGFCHQLAGNDVEAEAAYKAGIAKDPANRPCRVNYGLLLARQGKVEQAVVQWETVLTPAEVHYNLASVYEQRGDKVQARASYHRALELNPRFADARARLAQLDKD